MADSGEANAEANRRVLRALQEARQRLEAHERARSEPIAIIGMGCRVPGGAMTPDEFWQLLLDETDTVRPIPSERWDMDEWYHPEAATPGKMSTRSAALLDTIDGFDPQFFGISPREAAYIDPQHRLLLEVTWEALEHAGIPADRLQDSLTGVFVGIGQNDYGQRQLAGEPDSISQYYGTGNGLCFGPGRLSSVLGLRGPNLAIDTACSSSLLAVHIACQSLRSGECDLGLAGGSHLMLSPEVAVFLSQTKALAPDGRCKTFSASADGFGRGEGCGVIVLKRLSDARDHGDNVLAVIRGSAVNHDGFSGGLTVPSEAAQQQVIERALKDAGVTAADVSYIEAHGTGTSLGDPIEVSALAAVFADGRPTDMPLVIGSVKTNLGHLEAAAGIVGLMKTVMSLQHQRIPAHLHCSEFNPLIPWSDLPFSVPVSSVTWPAGDAPRIAGVSSFGMSGSNAHVVLAEAPPCSEPAADAVPPRSPHVLALSAASAQSLHALVQRYAAHLADNTGLRIQDVCHTANACRSHFPHRVALLADSTTALQAQLESLSQHFAGAGGLPNAAVVADPTWSGDDRGGVVFAFTGQGSQLPRMARDLFETHPGFRRTLERCDEILQPLMDRSLLSVLWDGGDLIHQTAYAQPALFAVEYALAELWMSFGIEPVALIGHSVGEYAAACIAGVFSLEDGLRLIAHRARLMQSAPGDGMMAAVRANEEQLRDLIEGTKVSIAVINGPNNVVLSGERRHMDDIVGKLQSEGIQCRVLQVSHAFHSELMEPVLTEFRRHASEVRYSAPRLVVLSNLDGQVADQRMASADYWCEHLRRPVRFADGMQTLLERGHRQFLEIGPQPTLLALTEALATDENLLCCPSLRSGRGDWDVLLQSLSKLYVHGVQVDWQNVDRGYRPQRVTLPTYPFDRQRFWISETTPVRSRNAGDSSSRDSSLLRALRAGDVHAVTDCLRESRSIAAGDEKLVAEIVQTLVNQCAEEEPRQPEQDCFYRMEWEQVSQSIAPTGRPNSGVWLIFADREGLGGALAARLHDQGRTVMVVGSGQDFLRNGDNEWTLNSHDSDHMTQLFQEIRESCKQPLSHVVHFGNLDTPCFSIGRSNAPTNPASIRTPGNDGVRSVLSVIQALQDRGDALPGGFWIVTRNAVAVQAEECELAVGQSPAWGLGRALSLDLPDLRTGMIDLSASQSSEEVALLLDVLSEPGNENQIAVRKSSRWAPRLSRYRPDFARRADESSAGVSAIAASVKPSSRDSANPVGAGGMPPEDRSPAAQENHVGFHSDVCYLITGGLGLIGLHCAEWMAAHGARHLVLTGRRHVPQEDLPEAIGRLIEQGIEIEVAQADVCDPEAMAALFARIDRPERPLRGIFHAAGVVGYEPIETLKWGSVESVLAAKVQGTWVLHELTRDRELDHFVLFSSIASLWGSMGQAHYAAANQFLDAMAHARSQSGRPCLSVNWGPWSGGGMTSAENAAQLKRIGVRELEPAEALHALGGLMNSNEPQVAIAGIDWSVFAQVYEARGPKPLLNRLVNRDRDDDAAATTPMVRAELDACRPGDRMAALQKYVREATAAVLGFASSEDVGIRTGFAAMGMDSLLAVELRNRIRRELGCPLSTTVAFDHPSVELLVGYLAQSVFEWTDGSAGQVQQESPATTDSDSQPGPEDDIDAMIADRLMSLESLIEIRMPGDRS